MEILKELFKLQDKEYAEFQSKLTPSVDKNKFIGVRVPEARKLAKVYFKDEKSREFLNILPHEYYDENMLHGLLISEIKDYEKCINEIMETDMFSKYELYQTLLILGDQKKVFNVSKENNVKMYTDSISGKQYTKRSN